MKKMFSLLLALLIMASLFTACVPKKDATASDSNTKSTELSSEETKPVKLTYWKSVHAINLSLDLDALSVPPAYVQAQNDTNVEIEWIHPAIGQEAEKFNIMIASGDLPDVIHYNWDSYPGGQEAAVIGNVIISLNDIVENNMPHLSKMLTKFPELVKPMKTDSGLFCTIPNIYANTQSDSKSHQGLSGLEPCFETYLGLYIRKDWLDQLNLPSPVTVDDWFTTLKAFKDEKGAKAPLSITMVHLKGTVAFASAFDITADFFVC